MDPELERRFDVWESAERAYREHTLTGFTAVRSGESAVGTGTAGDVLTPGWRETAKRLKAELDAADEAWTTYNARLRLQDA